MWLLCHIKLYRHDTNVRSFCQCRLSNRSHLIIPFFSRRGLGSSLQNDCCSIALQQKNGYLRQFLIGAFAENTHSLSSQIAGTFPACSAYFLLKAVPPIKCALLAPKREKVHTMGGELIGLVAVILGMGVPLGALYTYYRVRKLRSEERLAAIARGVDIPME